MTKSSSALLPVNIGRTASTANAAIDTANLTAIPILPPLDHGHRQPRHAPLERHLRPAAPDQGLPLRQRDLIARLTTLFPNTQFIATAHSPLVVQAAPDANVVVLKR